MKRGWVTLGLVLVFACGEAKRNSVDDGSSDAGASGEGAASSTSGAGGSAAGRGAGGNLNGAGRGATGGSAGDVGGGGAGAGSSGAAGSLAGRAGASGAGGSSGGTAGVENTPFIGPRCLDCPTPCYDETIRPAQLFETCTEPSPFAGLGVRFDLTVTLPDGSKRYLVDSPFDYEAGNYASWSYDSLGNQWFQQGLVCGKVGISGPTAGPVDPQSASAMVVTVDDVEYRSTNAPASAEFTAGEPSPGNDPDLGPMFDLFVAGTLVSDTGDAIQVEGRMRNVTAGRGGRGLGHRVVEGFSVAGATPRLSIRGDTVILGPISKTGQGAGMLLFDLGLTTETLVDFPTSVLSVVPFPESGVVGTGNLDPFLAAFEDTGAPRYQSATLTGDWLSSGYELPLARADGSSCMVGDPGVSFVDEGRPSVLACTDASGALLFQVSVSPIVQPQAPMELEDGGIVVMDVRSPHLRVVEPDGTARFDLTTCIPPGVSDPLPYFKGANAARTPDGGGVAQVGDDLISFAADGTLRWRSAIPFGDSTPLVASDGTVYALTRPAVLVALEPTGEVRWTLPVGNSGELIGLAEDGTIYVGSGFWDDYGLLLAVSPEGSITWSALSTTTGWVLAPDGNLYAYTRGEEPALESVRGDSPLASAGWPVPRGDARAAGTR